MNSEELLSIEPISQQALPIHEHTLTNGLRVVIVPKRTAPVVTVAVAYRVGSKDETDTHTGFAHLFEHLMFEGSANVANGQFDFYVSSAGGQNNAYTNSDKTVYHMTMPASQLEIALWLEADRMAAFNIDEIALKNQQDVVTEEIRQNVENTPFGMLSPTLMQAAFSPECSYSWDTYGSKEHVANATMADVRAFHNTFYRPNNAVLVICGDVLLTPTLQLVEKYFAQIPAATHNFPRRHFTSEMKRGAVQISLEDNVPMHGTFLAFHAPAFTQKDIVCAQIACSILSDGMSSRLYKSLVYEQQIASETNAYIDDREWTSLLSVYAIGVTPEVNSNTLAQALWKEISTFLAEEISDREMQKAKNRALTRIARYFQTSSGIADEIAHQTLFWNAPSRAFELVAEYESISKVDVQRVAREIFTHENSIRIDIFPKLEQIELS